MIDFSNISKLRTDLTEAINSNDFKRLKLLSNNLTFINLNYVDKEGQTPLHRSCTIGNLEICKLLVEFGASQNIRNSNGWYPIHIATYYGHVEIVMFLLNENNFKNESFIAVYDDQDKDSIKNRPNTFYIHSKSYRLNFQSNDDNSGSSEDEQDDEDDDINEYEIGDENGLENFRYEQNENNNNLFDLDENNQADGVIENFNDNEILSLLDLKNLDLNSADFIF